MKRDGWKTPRADRHGRLTCRACGAKVLHRDAFQIIERHRLCTCTACHERLDARDTGWRALNTPHGTRYHREVGTGLQLDVEHQPAGWLACASRDRQMLKGGIRCNLPSAAEAARSIEILANVIASPLPDLGEGGLP